MWEYKLLEYSLIVTYFNYIWIYLVIYLWISVGIIEKNTTINITLSFDNITTDIVVKG